MEAYILIGVLIGCIVTFFSVLIGSFLVGFDEKKEKDKNNLNNKIIELENHIEEQLQDLGDQIERLEEKVYDNDRK